MDEVLVVNTGPIITLARMDAFEVIRELPYVFWTTHQVVEELEAGRRKGFLNELPEWMHVESLDQPLRRFDEVILGKGEASVIQLALAKGFSRVCIDEVKGRRVAVTSGLAVLGVLGLLGRAKVLNLIDNMQPYIQKALLAGIRYDERLIQRVLESVGEA